MLDLSGPAELVAPSLLGCTLITHVDTETSVMITEVEAYAAAGDPASHSSAGETDRNRSMFGDAGTLYVYRSYGIHWCANVVTGPPGEGAAVLLRAGVPLRGRATMVERRGRDDHIADGPGKLCQALAITGAHDGTSILEAGPVRLVGRATDIPYESTKRIGISKATERLWRFVARP